MKITKRVVDTKRHTIGYIVNNNKRITRSEAVKFARKGKIRDVTVKHWANRSYITTVPSAEYNLYDLPVVVR